MLDALFRSPQVEQRSQESSVWGVWPGDITSGASKMPSTEDSLRLLAFSGCVKLISESISTLPVDVYTQRDGVKTEIPTPAWIAMPTVDLDFTSWVSQVVTSLLIYGNAYIVVTRSPVNGIVELVPQDPSLIHVARVNGRKVYVVGGREFPGEILHLKGMMLPGSDVGLSPLDYARKSINLGNEAVDYGSSQFANENNMPGVIELPRVAQPEQMRKLAQAWRSARRNRGLPGVLDDGGTFKPTGVTNEAAQYLQLRQWTAAEIASNVFLVDPRELGIPLQGSTLEYQNGETRKEYLLRKALLPWIIRIEAALSSLLPRPRFVKLNTDAFLRADSQTRWNVYATANGIGALTVDEIRELEDLPPLEDDSVDSGGTEMEPDVTEPRSHSEPIVVNVHSPAQATVPAEVRVEPAQVNVAVTIPESLADEQTQVLREVAETISTGLRDIRGAQVDPSEIAAALADMIGDAMPIPPEPKPTVRRVERDEDGRILRVIDEVVNG